MDCKLVAVVLLCVFTGSVTSKQCTNEITASHTFRYELLTSTNETWKKEMYSKYFNDPATSSVSALFSRKLMSEEGNRERQMKHTPSKDFLQEVSLHDVRLNPNTIHWHAQQTNLEYLLMLDVDNLVHNFRNNSKLPSPGHCYNGWEHETQELRGHFVGHYMSASALMWASTHNETLKERMSSVVSALNECQMKIGSGYLSAFPSEYFDRFENLIHVWAPYYTIHKIMAGLLDQYTFAGNSQALKMVSWMADYHYQRVQNVIKRYSIQRHFDSLNEETGGMNDVLYRLFAITGDQKHFILAHLFDKPCFLGILSLQADDLSGFHSNTHIPIVVGAQSRYEVTGYTTYRDLSSFFMDIVNSSHSYATGGTSNNEFWTDPKRMASALGPLTEESCTTHNMMKVARNLFRWTKEMKYADYYERALTNGVLSIQRGREPGVMIYTLPMGPGTSKAVSNLGWGTPFDCFWCCYGTGIESFSKLGDSIYFEDRGKEPILYVTQYVSSSLHWKTANLFVDQNVDSVSSTDPYLRVTVSISTNDGSAIKESTLKLRIPFWTHLHDAKVEVNSQSIPLAEPGSFLSISRKWNDGDKVTLQLPIDLRREHINDDREQFKNLQAVLYGPFLLAGYSNGGWQIGNLESMAPVPLSDNDLLVTMRQNVGGSELILKRDETSIFMGKMNNTPGDEQSVYGTFRLVFDDSSKYSQALNKIVKLELFDSPGMAILHNGRENALKMEAWKKGDGSSMFRVVRGLDGKNESISLEASDLKGCFVHGGAEASVKLSCESDTKGFADAASFVFGKGLAQYHPMSFVAKGDVRSYLLSPLLSFRDERYTIYFSIL